MDVSSIAAVLGSIKTATEIAKLINDSDTSLEKAEFKLKLADLISALANARIDIAAIQENLIEKTNTINELNQKLLVSSKVSWEDPYYFIYGGESKDGPYCQACYDKSKELIRLQGNGNGYWECKSCKNNFVDSSFDSSPALGIRSTSTRDPYDKY